MDKKTYALMDGSGEIFDVRMMDEHDFQAAQISADFVADGEFSWTEFDLAALREFVRKFADNFETCGVCNNEPQDDACRVCGSTGIQVLSYGTLLADLKPEADELLKRATK